MAPWANGRHPPNVWGSYIPGHTASWRLRWALSDGGLFVCLEGLPRLGIFEELFQLRVTVFSCLDLFPIQSA